MKRAVFLSACLVQGLLWLAAPWPLVAELYYVRPNAGTYGRGDGTDWNNAFSGLPTASSSRWGTGTGRIGPGDTVYVAGGTYTTQWALGSGGTSDTLRLTIRRATAADHGTDTGWAAGTMDAQVVVRNVGVVLSAKHFVTIDGAVSDGIKVTVPDTGSSDVRFIGMDLGPSNTNYSNNVTIRHVEIAGPGRQKDGETRGLQNADGNNLLVEDCHIHDIGSAFYVGGQGTIIQRNRIHDIDAAGSPAEIHENVLFITGGTGLIFRYNIVRNTTAVGVFTRYGGDYTEVYGNVFEKSAQAVLVDNRGGLTGIKVFNNTFVSCYMPVRYLAGTTEGLVVNNIFYTTAGDDSAEPIFETAAHDYNWYSQNDHWGEAHSVASGTEDPFVNLAGQDYHLKTGASPINRGRRLGSAYALDPDGKTRGSDGLWDIGATEGPDLIDAEAPQAPSQLEALAISSDAVTLAWAPSADNTGIRQYNVFRDSTYRGSIVTTEFSDTGLTPGQRYQYSVSARDLGGNVSPLSPSLSVTTLPPVPPDPPSNFRTLSVSDTQVVLAWTTTYSEHPIKGFNIYRDSQLSTSTSDTTYMDNTLWPATRYRYSLTAVDTSGVESPAVSLSILSDAAAAPDLGLIAAYSFDAIQGTTLHDDTEHGHDGAFPITPQTRAGIFGASGFFDGSNDRVEIPSTQELDLSAVFSLVAWVYPTAPVSGTQWIITRKGTSAPWAFALGACNADGVPCVQLSNASATATAHGSAPLASQAWTQLAATFDGETLRLYVNGFEQAQQAVAGPATFSDEPIYLAAAASAETPVSGTFLGRLDEVRLYNRSLTLGDVRALFNQSLTHGPVGARDWTFYQ